MRYRYPTTFAAITTLIVTFTCTAQQVDRAVEPADHAEPLTGRDDWGLGFSRIPQVLRLHCRPLGRAGGLLVGRVADESPAEMLGIRNGDILLESNGITLARPEDLGNPDETAELKIVRRGGVRFLPSMGSSISGRWHRSGGEIPLPAMPRGMVGGVSATSISSGSQTVSVNRVGDRISLSVSLPELGPGPVHFEGTRSEIQSELREADLPTGARQRIGRILDRAR